MTIVDAPLHLDLSYLEAKKYKDGLDENKIDHLRRTLAQRDHSIEV
jgi:hypothetical protein